MAVSELQARRYAQAVFEIAQEKNEPDKWQADLQKVAALAKDPDLVAVMDSPRYTFEDKSKLISGRLDDVGKLTVNLIKLLISQGKFGLLPGVAAEYQEMLDTARGILKAEVVTALPMEEKEKQSLAKNLALQTGKQVRIISRVDPQMIGGIVVRMGGKLFDGSLASRLAYLKEELVTSGSQG